MNADHRKSPVAELSSEAMQQIRGGVRTDASSVVVVNARIANALEAILTPHPLGVIPAAGGDYPGHQSDQPIAP